MYEANEDLQWQCVAIANFWRENILPASEQKTLLKYT